MTVGRRPGAGADSWQKEGKCRRRSASVPSVAEVLSYLFAYVTGQYRELTSLLDSVPEEIIKVRDSVNQIACDIDVIINTMKR